ncbi:MAG: IclR family transcriptional regulator, partial [Comamonadaceae bacterium]
QRIVVQFREQLPAWCTSMGRLLLSELDDDALRARLDASAIEAFTKHTVTDIDGLLARIAQARKQRWCVVNQELEEGLISIAAPIVNRSGRMVAALNISGQANRTSAKVMQETMLPALREAAQRISGLL